MTDSGKHIESEQLIAEILRYLAAVEAFRGVGCEPSWRPERRSRRPRRIPAGRTDEKALPKRRIPPPRFTV